MIKGGLKKENCVISVVFAFSIPIIGTIVWLLVRGNSRNINIDSFDVTQLKITKNTTSLGILEYFMWISVFIMIFLPISEYFNSTFVNDIWGGIFFLVLFAIAPICSYKSILTRPLLKKLMLSRVKKFVRDIKEKRWGKEIKEVVEQHLSPFEKQDESTIYLFEKLIEDRYGVRISTNGIRWVWEEILKTLEIKRKLLQDIQTNINPSLYSLVEKYRGNFSEGRKKFTEELIRIYKEDEIDYEVASRIWDEITEKIIKERIEKIKENLSKGKHFHLLYMVYTHGGFWIDKNSEIKGAFLHYLEEICNMKISKREANMVWNWISKYTKEEMQEMMRKGINLLMEIHNLGDEEISTRVNAAIKLGILGDKRAVRPLLEALKDRNMEVKIAAAEALGEIGDTSAPL